MLKLGEYCPGSYTADSFRILAQTLPGKAADDVRAAVGISVSHRQLGRAAEPRCSRASSGCY